MTWPSLSDGVALCGISLVLCALWAACLRLDTAAKVWKKWTLLALVLLLWLPAPAHFPHYFPWIAYVRGISGDFSVTLVALAGISLSHRLYGTAVLPIRERRVLLAAVVLTGLCFYPLALGLGDWDPYRAGWGSAGLWAALAGFCALCWHQGLRWLPVLLALALLAWALELVESRNLWDCLLDPWLFVVCLWCTLRQSWIWIDRRLFK